jgi:phosphate transport system protein
VLRAEYHDRLNQTRDLTMRLFAWSREMLKADLRAFQDGDSKAAGRVLSDDAVTESARQLRTQCVELFWRQQPLADEMRSIATMLQSSSDFERISFHEHELAKHAMRLLELGARVDLPEFIEMLNQTEKMLAGAETAFRDKNEAMADKVIEDSNEVDRLGAEALEKLQRATIENKELIPAATSQLLGVASLKRVAEHAENLAWHVKGMLEASMA